MTNNNVEQKRRELEKTLNDSDIVSVTQNPEKYKLNKSNNKSNTSSSSASSSTPKTTPPSTPKPTSYSYSSSSPSSTSKTNISSSSSPSSTSKTNISSSSSPSSTSKTNISSSSSPSSKINMGNQTKLVKQSNTVKPPVIKQSNTVKPPVIKQSNTVKPPVIKQSNNNNPPVVNQVSNSILDNRDSLGAKLYDIYFNSYDLFSNVIKFTTIIVVLLLLFVVVNIILTLQGNIQQSLLYLTLGVSTFLISEFLVELILGKNSVSQILGISLYGIGTLFLLLTIKKAYDYFSTQRIESPMILKTNKSARTSMVIPQTQDDPDSLILYRSDNENDGIEFTYTYWMLIEDYDYKNNEWKHIMHKGNKEGTPNMCPGFQLHPTKNSMRVYFNTMKNMKEHFDIDNLPLKKWISVALTVKQRVVELFINGMLKKRHTLSSVPRQNFGELWINLYGGFDGFMSKIQYHRRALEYAEISELIRDGPSSSACIDSEELPPYLDDDWWLNSTD